MTLTRRWFLGGLVAAPAVILQPKILMPLRGLVLPERRSIWLSFDASNRLGIPYNGLVSYLSDFSDVGEPYTGLIKQELERRSKRSALFDRPALI